MKSYTIHLIRHSITRGNLLGQYVGRTDPPLATEGVRRLNELRRIAPYPAAQVYYSSPLQRCLQTLEILYPGVKPIVVDDFRECDFGDWEGKTAQELARESGTDFSEWVQSSRAVTPPNGESGGAFLHRVCAAFEKLVEGMMRSGTTSAVIVAHGGTIMSILTAYGLPRAKFYEWMTENGCGYSMRITPGLWMRSMVAEVYAQIPTGKRPVYDDQKLVIDLARAAADRAYGEKNAPGKK